jgi:selenocysteine-specific elongation factor
VLDEPLVALPGDRFVIRDETAVRTIGGGVVLSAHAARHRRARGEVAPSLRALEDDDASTRLAAALDLSPAFGLTAAEAAVATGLDAPAVVALASRGPEAIVLGDTAGEAMLVSSSRYSAYADGLLAEITRYQAAHANLPGVDLEHLRGACRPLLDARLFRLVLEKLEKAGSLVRAGSVVRTRSHSASLGAADEALAARMLTSIESAGVMPPVVKDLASGLGAEAPRVVKVAAVLVLRGDLVKVSPDLYYARASLEAIRDRLEAHLRQHREITPAAFRDLIAASRKYCIPLLDWFDRDGLTIRVGDLRRLRKS